MIIDAHLHIEHESPQALYEAERAAGVDRAVCWSIWNDSAESNRLTAAAHAAYPDFFIPWGHVRPTDDYWPDELRRIAREYRWSGLKLHFGEFRNRNIQGFADFRRVSELDLAHREALFSIVEQAQDYGLPLLIDCTGLYHIIQEVCEQFTRTPIIIPHLGAREDFVGPFSRLAHRLPHVYLDLSFVHVYRHMQTAYEIAGADKLIWGSDGYWMDPAVELAKLQVVAFTSSADREKVLWRNIAGILDLPEA